MLATLTMVALILVVAVALIAIKLERDAIRQGGARVGSALFAGLIAPVGEEARFVVVRGEAAFRPDRPFRHQGRDFRILSAERYDDRSTVLRRWFNVVCRVERP